MSGCGRQAINRAPGGELLGCERRDQRQEVQRASGGRELGVAVSAERPSAEGTRRPPSARCPSPGHALGVLTAGTGSAGVPALRGGGVSADS